MTIEDNNRVLSPRKLRRPPNCTCWFMTGDHQARVVDLFGAKSFSRKSSPKTTEAYRPKLIGACARVHKLTLILRFSVYPRHQPCFSGR